jgi:sugar lactone lactonase YvrE
MEQGPKLVVWDTVNEREVFRHVFSSEIAPPAGSFLNDIAVDEDHGFAYISESGIGGTPCIIAFEIHRDIAIRVLEGHVSVVPDADRTMMIDEEPVMLHLPDGPIAWRVAVNTIGLSPGSDYLTYAPMTSDQLYRVPTLALRDARLSEDERAAAVEPWGPKPISDGMAYAPDGAVFITDVEGSRIATMDSELTTVVADERFTFPVAIEATDTEIWFTTNQLHLMPILLAGEDLRQPPYFLWRVPREATRR